MVFQTTTLISSSSGGIRYNRTKLLSKVLGEFLNSSEVGTNEQNVLHPPSYLTKESATRSAKFPTHCQWLGNFFVFKDLGNCCPENRDCLPALKENRRDHPQGTPGCSHVWTGSEGFKFLPTVPKNSDWQNRNCQIDH